MQMTAWQEVIHRGIQLGLILHIRLHNAGACPKVMKGNQIIVLTVDRDGRIVEEEESH
jgi:hypothetical protein